MSTLGVDERVNMPGTARKWPNESVGLRGSGLAGLLACLLIIGCGIVGPQLVAGPRVSGTTDETVIRAYYAHDTLGPLTIGLFLAAPALLVFFFGLREALQADSRARFFGTLGLLFGLANMPLYLAASALQATLVTVAQSGASVGPWFRFWDVYYNSAGYAFEIGFLFCFALAMRRARWSPRWVPVLGFTASLLQVLNMLALWIGLPDIATMPGNVALLAFFASASLLLLKRAGQNAHRIV